MVRSLDIKLKGCAKSSCEIHLEKEWPVLEQICDHLGSNLKDMVFSLSLCSVAKPNPDLWIERFAEEMRERGITSCTVWESQLFMSSYQYYQWAASTSQSSLVDLMRRTVRGRSPRVVILGSQDAALSVPANVLEMLSSVTVDGLFSLHTNINIQSLANLQYLNKCRVLQLYNRAAIEDEEVTAVEGILAQVAVDPRPRDPQHIWLPKVNKQCFSLICKIP